MTAILNLHHARKIGEQALPEWQATDTIMDLGCRTIPGKGKHTCHHLFPKSRVSYFHFPTGGFFPTVVSQLLHLTVLILFKLEGPRTLW